MADRPILFSAPMVRALLDGRKTQTRRLLRNPEYYGCPTGDCPHNTQAECNVAMQENALPDVRYAPGDRLYVREHWSTHPAFDGIAPRDLKRGSMFYTRADGQWHNNGDWIGSPFGKLRQGMHMPRWASRLTLTVTDVRVQRLQDISRSDCYSEGIQRPKMPNFGSDVCATDNARMAFRELWNSINGPDAWDANPWVVAMTFDAARGNIDGVV